MDRTFHKVLKTNRLQHIDELLEQLKDFLENQTMLLKHSSLSKASEAFQFVPKKTIGGRSKLEAKIKAPKDNKLVSKG